MFGDRRRLNVSSLIDVLSFRREPLSAAGQMLNDLDEAERNVQDLYHITDELRAQLRRCEIRSKWPTWDMRRSA